MGGHQHRRSAGGHRRDLVLPDEDRQRGRIRHQCKAERMDLRPEGKSFSRGQGVCEWRRSRQYLVRTSAEGKEEPRAHCLPGFQSMTSTQWHLAQVNIGRARGSITDPVMQGFVARLDEINALAEQSPGFVWRLQTEDGNATAFRPYAD